MEESGKDSSEVEVFIFFIAINLVQVNVFGEVIKDVNWVSYIGLGISFQDLGSNGLFFKVERDFVLSFYK